MNGYQQVECFTSRIKAKCVFLGTYFSLRNAFLSLVNLTYLVCNFYQSLLIVLSINICAVVNMIE